MQHTKKSTLWTTIKALVVWGMFTSFVVPFLLGIMIYHTWLTNPSMLPKELGLFLLALCAVWEIARLANHAVQLAEKQPVPYGLPKISAPKAVPVNLVPRQEKPVVSESFTIVEEK